MAQMLNKCNTRLVLKAGTLSLNKGIIIFPSQLHKPTHTTLIPYSVQTFPYGKDGFHNKNINKCKLLHWLSSSMSTVRKKTFISQLPHLTQNRKVVWLLAQTAGTQAVVVSCSLSPSCGQV